MMEAARGADGFPPCCDDHCSRIENLLAMPETAIKAGWLGLMHQNYSQNNIYSFYAWERIDLSLLPVASNPAVLVHSCPCFALCGFDVVA